MDNAAMEPHSDSPQQGANGRASFNWFFGTLVFIFVIYPLSTGPTGLLQTKFPVLETPRHFLYAPLQLLCDIYPPALDYFRWYIDSWLNLTP